MKLSFIVVFNKVRLGNGIIVDVDHGHVIRRAVGAKKSVQGIRPLASHLILRRENQQSGPPDGLVLDLLDRSADAHNPENTCVTGPVLGGHAVHDGQGCPDQAIVLA